LGFEVELKLTLLQQMLGMTGLLVDQRNRLLKHNGFTVVILGVRGCNEQTAATPTPTPYPAPAAHCTALAVA